MRAKQFFYICAGVLMLAVAYQLGVSRADAQSGGEFSGITFLENNTTVSVTTAGDIYARTAVPQACATGLVWNSPCGTDNGWTYMGNVVDGTVQVEGTTLSDVKGRYRKGNK